MSISSNGKLTVAPSEAIDLERIATPLIEITDGTLALIARESVELRDRAFAPGVYQVRVQSSGGKAYEEMVFLRPNKTTTVTYPVKKGEVLASPAPVPGTEAMHEYLRRPVDKAIGAPSTLPCRIVLMASHAGIAKPAIDLSAFRLLDGQGGEVSPIATEGETGHAGRSKLLSWDVKAGGFILEGVADGFGEDKRLRLPLYCCPDWCVLVFVGMQPGTGSPDLNTASIYFWRVGTLFAPEQVVNGAPFQPVLKSQRDTELALHSLVSGRSFLSFEEVDTGLLVEKFQNPMLGILGCHLLFERKALDARLISTVLKNLERLIPGHPDVMALKVMAARAGIKQAPVFAAWDQSWPPLIYDGLRALRDEDWAKPGTIREDSLFDRIRARVIPGGAWTRWIAQEKNEEFASTPKRATPPKSDPIARARVLSAVLHGVLAFTKLLDVKSLRANDLMDSGLSRQQARLAASVVNTQRSSRPAIAYAKKKAAGRPAKPKKSSVKLARAKAAASRPIAKSGTRRNAIKGRPRRG
jgi:hypothetical protein